MKSNDEWKRHIETNVSIDGKTGCWNWKKATRSDGYGITWYNGTTDYIHRVSYIIYKGEFDSNYIVRHTCDNRCCCNPEHLLIGSCQDNSTDMVNRGRQTKGSKQHLAKLHEDFIQDIRESSLSSRELGKQYNVSKSVILDVKNRKIWKSV